MLTIASSSLTGAFTLIARGPTGAGPKGGVIEFSGTADATAVRVVTEPGTYFDFSARTSGLRLGSIECGETVLMGGNALTVGFNDLSTEFSGVLAGGATASLEKVGTGTLILTESNTYARGTTVRAGTLEVRAPSYGLGLGDVSILPAARLVYTQSAVGDFQTFTVHGSATVGESGGLLRFIDTSSAGRITLLVKGVASGFNGGVALFEDASNAGTSTNLTVEAGAGANGTGGTLIFTGTAMATGATIVNQGGLDHGASGGLTQFRQNARAGTAMLTNEDGGNGSAGRTQFLGNNSAGTATIVNKCAAQISWSGGLVTFTDNATAGSATLRAESGLVAGATGGAIRFESRASGGLAHAVIEAGGSFDISALTVPSLSIGSVEGAGAVFRTLTLNGGTLTTGALVNNGTFNFYDGTLAITGAAGFNIGTSGALGTNVLLGLDANLQVTNTATIANGAQVRVNGGNFSASSIVNDGTIDHRFGALDFTGTLTNNAAGRLFISGLASPAGAITNAGRITLQGGLGLLGGAGAITNTGVITGDGTVAKPVTNSAGGQLRAEAGKTLLFTGAVAANAGTLIAAGLTNNGQMELTGDAGIYGDVTNAAGARIVTTGGATTTFYDDVIHNGTEIRTSAGCATVFLGAVSGAGSYTGTGTVYFEGDLRPGAQYDHLNVGGTLFADGILEVVLYGGFAPHFGDTFDLFDAGNIAGIFDDVNLPGLAGDLTWDDSQFSTTGHLRVVREPGIGALLGLRRSCSKKPVILSAVEESLTFLRAKTVGSTRAHKAPRRLRPQIVRGSSTPFPPACSPVHQPPLFPSASSARRELRSE